MSCRTGLLGASAIALASMAPQGEARAWEINGPPTTADVTTSPGLETLTVVPGYGWALWSEKGEVLWIAPASDETTERVPIWGSSPWNVDASGGYELLVATRSSNGAHSLHVLDENGFEILPGGSTGPVSSLLSNVTAIPLVVDVDGNGDMDFVRGTTAGFVRANDNYEMTELIWAVQLAQNPSSPAYVAAAELTSAPGTEVVASYAGSVALLEFDGSDVVATALPLQSGVAFDWSPWPPSASPAGGAATASTIAVCDDDGTVYRWTKGAGGFALQSGFPKQLSGIAGPAMLGKWNGAAAIVLSLNDRRIQLLGDTGSTVAGFPRSIGTKRRSATFAAVDRIVVDMDPNRFGIVTRSGSDITVSYYSTDGGPPPTPGLPASVPDASEVVVTINDQVLGQQILSGDYVPDRVTIEALRIDAGAGGASGVMTIEATQQGRNIHPHATTSSNASTKVELDLVEEEATIRVLLEDAVLKEFTLRVEESLLLEDVLAYPNPAEDEVEFQFVASRAGDATVRVYTLAGRVAARLPAAISREGYNHIYWDLRADNGHRVANGTYLYTVTVRSGTETRKVTGRLSVAR